MRWLLLIFLFGCNPVKQVLKDQGKFNQVAEEVIRRGYCVNDTTIITETKDSVVYKDSIIEVISSIPCKDFDTTIGRARISVSSGVLTYSAKDSVTVRTKTVTKIVRDLSLEGILKKDINRRDSIVAARNIQISELQIAKKAVEDSKRRWQFKFWLFVIAVVGWSVGKRFIRYQLSRL